MGSDFEQFVVRVKNRRSRRCSLTLAGPTTAKGIALPPRDPLEHLEHLIGRCSPQAGAPAHRHAFLVAAPRAGNPRASGGWGAGECRDGA